MQSHKHHAPIGEFSSDVPLRMLALLALTLLVIVGGVQLLRWARYPGEPPIQLERVTMVDDVQSQIYGVDERSGMSTDSESTSACTDQSCASPQTNMSVASDMESASSAARGLDGPPAVIPSGNAVSVHDLGDGKRTGEPEGSVTARMQRPTADKAVKRPRVATGKVSPTKPAEVQRAAAPFASDTLQKFVGQRADRLLTDYLRTQRTGADENVTKVVVSYAMGSGCNLTVDDVAVRATSASLANEVKQVMSAGIPQRLSAPGCAQMEGPLAGDVTVINVPAAEAAE